MHTCRIIQTVSPIFIRFRCRKGLCIFTYTRGGGGGGSVNSSQPRIGLIDPDQRRRSQADIANDLQRKLGRFNDARIFAVQEQTISVGAGSRGSLPIQFILQNQDLNKLKEVIPKFLEEVRKDKTFSNADVNLKFNKPEVQITLDRMKIKDLGLSTQDVISAMQAGIQWRKACLLYTKRLPVPGNCAGRPAQTGIKPMDITRLYVRMLLVKIFRSTLLFIWKQAAALLLCITLTVTKLLPSLHHSQKDKPLVMV